MPIAGYVNYVPASPVDARLSWRSSSMQQMKQHVKQTDTAEAGVHVICTCGGGMDARLSLRSSSMGRPPAPERMHSSTSASDLQQRGRWSAGEVGWCARAPVQMLSSTSASDLHTAVGVTSKWDDQTV